MKYDIFIVDDPLVAWPATDTQIRLVGSIGSYALKVDKSTASHTRTVFLRATTKGLNTILKKLEFSVCPVGGTNVTPFAPEFFATVDVGSSGKNANFNFGAWNIKDIYRGCAVFTGYTI